MKKKKGLKQANPFPHLYMKEGDNGVSGAGSFTVGGKIDKEFGIL